MNREPYTITVRNNSYLSLGFTIFSNTGVRGKIISIIKHGNNLNLLIKPLRKPLWQRIKQFILKLFNIN